MSSCDEREVDLRATVVNISLMRGDAWSLPVTITGYDLTGYTIRAQVRPDFDSTEVDDITVTPVNLSIGKFLIGQTDAQIDGFYDVQLTPGGGVPRTYLRGTIGLDSDVTHD